MGNNDTQVNVGFGASTGDLEQGVKRVSDAMTSNLEKIISELQKLNSSSGTSTQKVVADVKKMEVETGNSFGRLKDLITGHVGGVKDGIEGLGGVVGKFTGLFAGLTVLLAGGAAFSASINAFKDETAEVKRLMNGLGMTSEEAAKFNTQLKLVGMSSEEYVGIAMKFNRQLKTNEAGLVSMGVATRDGNGKLLDQQTLLKNATATMMTYKAGVDRNEFAMTAFGRSAESAFALLKLNEQTTARAAELTKAFGREMDDVAMAKAKDYKMAMAEVKLAGESLMAHIGEALMPGLTALGKTFVSIAEIAMPEMVRGTEGISKGVEDLATTLKENKAGIIEVFTDIGIAIKGVLELFSDLNRQKAMQTAEKNGELKFDWGSLQYKDQQGNAVIAAGASGKRFLAQREATNAAHAAEGSDMDTPQYGMNYARPKDSSKPAGTRDFVAPEKSGKGGGTGSSAEESYVPKWDAQLADEKVYYSATHDLQELSKQQEVLFWQSALDQAGTTEKEKLEISRKISRLRLEIQKEERKTAQGLANESIKAEQAAAMGSLALDEEVAKTKYELDQTSFAEYQKQLIEFENRKFEIEQAAQEKLIALDKNNPNNAVKVSQDNARLLQLAQAHGLAIRKIEDATVKESAKKWTDLFKTIKDGFASSIGDFMVGTKNFASAMKGIYTSIQGAFSTMIGKAVVDWGAGELAKLGISEAFSSLLIALHLKSAAEETTISAATTVPIVTDNAIKAGSGAAASQAGIPIIGPALAAVAFAATIAMVMGGLHSASGGYDIPAGINPITQLHQSEMVLPAKYADVIRGMAGSSTSSGGTQSGGDIHLHVNAVDAHSVRRLFQDNGSALADSLKHQMRNLKR